MLTLKDPESYMPGEAAVAEIETQINEYNKARPAIYSACQRNAALALLVYAGFALMACLYAVELDLPSKAWVGFIGVIALGGVGVYTLMWRPMVSHQARLRDRLFPKLFGFIEDVTYQKNSKPGFLKHITELKLVRYQDAANDDMIAGRHEGLDFAMLETKLTVGNKNKEIVFRGLIFHFRLDDPFPGTLVVARRGGWWERTMKDFWRTGPSLEMSSGNRQLDESHQFYSDNREAARPLITGPLTSALIWFGNEWHGGDVRMAMSGEHGYLMLPSSHDYFELPGHDRDVVYERHVKPLVRELVMALAVAHFVQKVAD